jgi:hypothetical protein
MSSWISFKEYLSAVETTFGKESKMFTIASVYDAFTVRDNYQLKIVKKPSNDEDNFLVLSPMKIVINSYKTDGYGKLVFILKKPLETLLTKYMKQQGLGVGDYLFGDKPLTQFLSANNKKLNLDIKGQGAINLLRHMKITDELKHATPEERLRLSEIMGHSPITQKAYLKSLKLI